FWIWLIISIAEMVNVGVTAVASRRYGEGRPEAAARGGGDAAVLSLLLGVLAAACGPPLLRRMFDRLLAELEVARLGAGYFGTTRHARTLERAAHRTSDGDDGGRVLADLRDGDAHGDAVRHAGARGARDRSPRGELAVHDRCRLRRGDGGDRRPEPRRGTRRA